MKGYEILIPLAMYGIGVLMGYGLIPEGCLI